MVRCIRAYLRRPLLASLGMSCVALTGAARVARHVGQDAPGRSDHEQIATAAILETTFAGQVLRPNGAPAAGAVVVTSAGGQVVTGSDGRFEIAVRVPIGAEHVQITAIADSGIGALTANARVAATAPAGRVPAGALVLAATWACQPSWLPEFGGMTGVDDDVYALAVYDDGAGPALYAGGRFTQAGGVAANHVAKWDGTSWSALGTGTNDTVYALAVYDDGHGPALYVAGLFTSTTGLVWANHVARWDGTYWTALGDGTDQSISALAVYDDGGGPALYAGGSFTHAGGVAASRVAKWNGASWSPLGSGCSASVRSLAAHDDGSGPALYVGGDFASAGGVTAYGIARWNGASWSALGSGANGSVAALTTFDDGGGPALYAGGMFTQAGGVSTNQVARWDGTSWNALGTGTGPVGPDHGVLALAAYDDGSGAALYAGGTFTLAGGVAAASVAKWDGSSWSALGGGTQYVGEALIAYDDGGGAALYAGGAFHIAGDQVANRIAKWDGASWSPVGCGTDDSVLALTVHDDGTGRALYAGGWFTTVGGVAANRIARWDGTRWAPLGTGADSSYARVAALASFDDGTGPALYAAGGFTSAGGIAANNVAKWDGTGWSPLAGGLTSGLALASVSALAVYDDGGGPALYAGGHFQSAGGVAASNIAVWDGTSWSALGSGIEGPGSVHALAVYDDGGGPALYAGGGFFTAGGLTANDIARWDGTAWSTLGTGIGSPVVFAVFALTAHDDGSGPALYAGGSFTKAGGVTVDHVARWDGTSWSALGSGTSATVLALTSHDDGSGPALYAGGRFTTAGGLAASSIAKWNGSSWSALGSGLGGVTGAAYVSVLKVDEDGCSPALCAGGTFTSSPAGDSFLAKWACPAIANQPGCAGNPATLAATSSSAPLGAPLPLKLTSSAQATGVALVYFGANGLDGSGCGFFLPGLGELLLALVPNPLLVTSGALVGGTSNLAVAIPSLPSLSCITIHLQGAAVVTAPAFAIEFSNALAVTLGP